MMKNYRCGFKCSKATALLIAGVVATISKQYAKADEYLQISLAKYREIDLTTGISIVLSGLGRNAVTKREELKKPKIITGKVWHLQERMITKYR